MKKSLITLGPGLQVIKLFLCSTQVTSRRSVAVRSAIVLHLVGDWSATSSE